LILKDSVNWIHVAQDSCQWWVHVGTVMNFWIPIEAGNFLSSLPKIGFSRRALLERVNELIIFTLEKRQTA